LTNSRTLPRAAQEDPKKMVAIWDRKKTREQKSVSANKGDHTQD
jgi:hypothetical protein